MTNNTDMIERVARAICDTRFWNHAYGNAKQVERDEFRREAIAAIRAIFQWKWPTNQPIDTWMLGVDRWGNVREVRQWRLGSWQYEGGNRFEPVVVCEMPKVDKAQIDAVLGESK